ncbi:hypothetical protein D3C86_2123590 [compost metagenome]
MFEINHPAVAGLTGQLQQSLLAATEQVGPFAGEQPVAGGSLQISEKQGKHHVDRAHLWLGTVLFSAPFQKACISPSAVNVLCQ